MVKKSFISYALRILENIILLELPLEIDLGKFNENMNILLSKNKKWLQKWNSIYINLENLILFLRKTNIYLNIQFKLKIIKIFLVITIIISALMSFFNPLAFITVPFLILILIGLVPLRKILFRKRISHPNSLAIKKYIKKNRKELIDLMKFLRLNEK